MQDVRPPAGRSGNGTNRLLPRHAAGTFAPAFESTRHGRQATRHRRAGLNFWTDAYLSAFAAMAGLTLVTFDRAFAHHSTATVRVLEP
jgi:predicted nucleic acid-binding protein